MAPRPVSLAILALALVLTACAPALTLPDGTSARTWGDGVYGVVLVPDAGRDPGSLESVGEAWAEHGMTVLAPADPSARAVVAGIEHLHDTGVERVAVVALGAGTEGAMEVGRERPELVDQLIVVSARGSADGLGVFPKLFVASEGGPAAADARRMAEEAAGDWNLLYLARGEASGQNLLEGEEAPDTLDVILRRLEERR